MRIDPREGPGDANAGWATPLSVQDRMSKPAVIVSAHASLAEALRLMLERRIHYLPVVDDDGHLVGMVNEDDVLGIRRGPRACFLLTFRAIAQASRIQFTSLTVDGEGIVDRADGGMRFTEIVLRPRLVIPAGADPIKMRRALEKAEKSCLVSASLSTPIRLEPEIVA